MKFDTIQELKNEIDKSGLVGKLDAILKYVAVLDPYEVDVFLVDFDRNISQYTRVCAMTEKDFDITTDVIDDIKRLLQHVMNS